MALYHFAYTFDPVKFHSDLEEKILENDRINLHQLRELAISVVNNASNEILEILANIRYDDEWLDNPDDDLSQGYLWYTINLAANLKLSPSLSNNRFRSSHVVLELVLPQVGWTQAEINDLVLGKRLSTLAETFSNESMLEELTLHGGCLSLKDTLLILEHLRKSRSYFSPPATQSIEKVSEFAELHKVLPEELLRMAYEDAIDMLEEAIRRSEALYILRDS